MLTYAARRAALAALPVAALLACGSSQVFPDATPRGDSSGVDGGATDGSRGPDVRAPMDAAGDDVRTDDVPTAGDVSNIYDTAVSDTGGCGSSDAASACTRVEAGCGTREVCDNGLDDDCNGVVDEHCACLPGEVQSCFLGPPGRRNVGACRDGTQRCVGSSEFGEWSACAGGISPAAETCDNLDNSCDGCVDDGLCCTTDLRCPGPGDPRVPDGAPFANYALHGAQFFTGTARSWRWTVAGGPCDAVLPTPTYTLTGANTADPVFRPTLSGDYTVTMSVTDGSGAVFTCTFVVHIAGPGLRVELCWDTSTSVDLDLYLHDPRNMDDWFSGTASPLTTVNLNSCNWSDCEATIRGSRGRSNWGYADSPLAECVNGPHGTEWRALGHCANPRLDIDNNLVEGSGIPENVNVDQPRDGESFRIMVQNYSGTAAHPVVNVYCGGHLRATMGAAPDTLPDFTGMSGGSSIGAMWRAADVRVRVDGTGVTTDCDVTPLHTPGWTSGYYVTRGDPTY